MAGNPGQVACDLFVVRLFPLESARLLKIQPGQLFFQLFAAASKSFLCCHGRFLLFYAIKAVYHSILILSKKCLCAKGKDIRRRNTITCFHASAWGFHAGRLVSRPGQDYDFFRKSGGMRVLRCEVQTGRFDMKRTGLALLGLVIVLAFLPAPFSVHAAGHECTRPVARVTALDPLSGEAWNWVLWDEEAVWISRTQETASDGSKMRREVVWTFDLGPFLRETFPSDEAPAADAKVWLVVRTEHSDGTSGKVIETHSSYTFVDAQGGAYRPGCTVRWSSGSLGENGNLYPTLSQAGEGLENDGPFRVLHIG